MPHEGIVPVEAYPTSKRIGAYNYTIDNGRGARVEVNLKYKKFWIKKVSEGAKPLWERGAIPTLSWQKLGGVETAWAMAKDLTGW